MCVSGSAGVLSCKNVDGHCSVAGRLRIGGSPIGGIKETQEMLNFCSKHNIACEVEEINIDYVNKAMERLLKNDVHYRFVIDVQGSLIQ